MHAQDFGLARMRGEDEYLRVLAQHAQQSRVAKQRAHARREEWQLMQLDWRWAARLAQTHELAHKCRWRHAQWDEHVKVAPTPEAFGQAAAPSPSRPACHA